VSRRPVGAHGHRGEHPIHVSHGALVDRERHPQYRGEAHHAVGAAAALAVLEARQALPRASPDFDVLWGMDIITQFHNTLCQGIYMLSN